ncbi:MAG: TerB family tellurite resistance protein [Bacteroidota bacterium]
MKDNPHLDILVQLAKIDGEADGSELELIREIGASKNVSDEDIEEIIDKTEAMGTLPSLGDLSQQEKIDLMTNLVMVMKIDGRIHKEEMKFCLKVLRKLGYDEDALFELVSTTYVSSENPLDREAIKKRAATYLQ